MLLHQASRGFFKLWIQNFENSTEAERPFFSSLYLMLNISPVFLHVLFLMVRFSFCWPAAGPPSSSVALRFWCKFLTHLHSSLSDLLCLHHRRKGSLEDVLVSADWSSMTVCCTMRNTAKIILHSWFYQTIIAFKCWSSPFYFRPFLIPSRHSEFSSFDVGFSVCRILNVWLVWG